MVRERNSWWYTGVQKIILAKDKFRLFGATKTKTGTATGKASNNNNLLDILIDIE